mmetsp:Transcript_27272/g.68850  ORF Transcript_27272/g.68850 Transcript_27272/m.68850 type:complete len:286 (-) Transcript_27272:402-1259(-)
MRRFRTARLRRPHPSPGRRQLELRPRAALPVRQQRASLPQVARPSAGANPRRRFARRRHRLMASVSAQMAAAAAAAGPGAGAAITQRIVSGAAMTFPLHPPSRFPRPPAAPSKRPRPLSYGAATVGERGQAAGAGARWRRQWRRRHAGVTAAMVKEAETAVAGAAGGRRQSRANRRESVRAAATSARPSTNHVRVVGVRVGPVRQGAVRQEGARGVTAATTLENRTVVVVVASQKGTVPSPRACELSHPLPPAAARSRVNANTSPPSNPPSRLRRRRKRKKRPHP